MDKIGNRVDLDALEAMIDATSVSAVLEALAEVCSLKATHIAEAWGDYETATNWECAATSIDRVAAKISI